MTDKTNQYDLMLSNRASDQESSDMVTNSPDPYDGVQITFNHALSAIKFAVNTDNDYSVDDYTITLKSLTVKNAFSKGDLTQFADIGSPDAINLSSLWSNQEDEAAYEVTSTPAVLSTASTTFSDEDDADLVLLPQDLEHSSPGKNVVVEVVYTVSHPDMGSGNSIEYTKDLEIATASIDTWDAGKRYIYDITIGMDQIVFAPKVTAWDTQTTIEI